MSEETTDYNWQDLTGKSFAGRNLTGYNFSGANLTDVNFTGAVVTDANFEHAHFERTVMVGAKLDAALNLPDDKSGIIHHVRMDFLTGKIKREMIPDLQVKLADAVSNLKAERQLEISAHPGGIAPSAGWRLHEIENAAHILDEIQNPQPKLGCASK